MRVPLLPLRDRDGRRGVPRLLGGSAPRMTIEAIPFECGRFFVSSESRKGMLHLVDLHEKTCSCEQCQRKDDHACKHLRATVEHERKRLNL